MYLINKINSFDRIKKNKALLNGMLFSLFSFINKGFSFLLVLILANYITPGEYGYLSLFVTFLMVLGYFMALSTEGYLSISYFKNSDIGIKQTVSGILLISSVVLLSLLIIISLLGVPLENLTQLNANCLYLAVIICFFTVSSNIFLDLFRLKEKVMLYGAICCSNALLNFITTILLVKYVHLGWMGRVYSQFACFSIYGLFGILYFAYKGYIVLPSSSSLKKMIMWGLPIIPHLATSFIRQGCDRYIINYYHTISDVGLFSFALNLANIVVMIGVGFNQSNSVEIFKVLGDKTITNREKKQKLLFQRKQFVKIYCILTLITTVIGYFIFPLVLPKYANSMNYFLLLAIWGLGQCLYLLYTNYLFYYDKTKSIMYITFCTSLLHLLLSLLLTRYSLFFTCSIYIITQFVICFFIRKKAKSLLVKYLI